MESCGIAGYLGFPPEKNSFCQIAELGASLFEFGNEGAEVVPLALSDRVVHELEVVLEHLEPEEEARSNLLVLGNHEAHAGQVLLMNLLGSHSGGCSKPLTKRFNPLATMVEAAQSITSQTFSCKPLELYFVKLESHQLGHTTGQLASIGRSSYRLPVIADGVS